MQSNILNSALIGNREKLYINNLGEVEVKVFSQWGEDGIIDWLVSRSPPLPQRFVEIGVENYTECNTRALLQLRNWSGLVIDGSPKYIKSLSDSTLSWMYDLNPLCLHVTQENIVQNLKEQDFLDNIGLLSVDIDGVDYYVLREILEFTYPMIIVTEFNGIFGDMEAITIPYRSDFDRFLPHYSGLCFGASICALTDLLSSHEYDYLGSGLNGINAYFARKELGLLKNVECVTTYACKHRDGRAVDGSLARYRGEARLEILKDCRVIDLRDQNKVKTIGQFEQLYSDQWISQISGRIVK